VLKVVEAFTSSRTGPFFNARRGSGTSFLAAACLVFFVVAISVVLPPVLRAQTNQQEPDVKVFDLASDPDFKNYQQVLAAYARKHRPRSDNDFCVVGYLTRDGLKSAWVIWQQKQKIILWEGQKDLDLSRRTIDLKTDVVPTENDLHGSTYRETQAWVNKVTSLCERSGVKVDIPRR
jgi:hypothetical protein